MKKEDFPTFLNEQPTVIFGRTVRELLWITCGIVCTYEVWSNINDALHDTAAGMALGIALGVVVAIVFLTLALLPVGGRPLEEWAAVWLMYAIMPKLYLYKPAEEEIEYENPATARPRTAEEIAGKRVVDPDILED